MITVWKHCEHLHTTTSVVTVQEVTAWKPILTATSWSQSHVGRKITLQGWPQNLELDTS